MAAARPAVRETARPTTKDTNGKRLRHGEVLGRNGEILRFRSTSGGWGDIPEELMEPGWTYQWQAATLYGEPSNDLSVMYANGWRYVMADSRIGQYFAVPGDSSASIMIGGLVLMERPKELTDMYIEETNEKTRLQYAKLSDSSSDLVVPSGFDNLGKRVRRERALVSQSELPDDLRANSSLSSIPDEE